MKGTILVCMQDLVTKKFGQEPWKQALKLAGFDEQKIFTIIENVPDAQTLALMKAVGTVAHLPAQQVMEAFGEYWSTEFAPSIYKGHFARAKSTREFLLTLDRIHVEMTRTMKAAHPPRFRYEWTDEQHLVMHYESERSLAMLMPGLIRGLGKHYHDHQRVSVKGNEVHVQFS